MNSNLAGFQVSVDYLTKPIDVFKEMQRILKPEGLAIMSFSNRCFWTKAISIWTSTGDVDHAWIVGSYFHYAGGFEPPVILTSPLNLSLARRNIRNHPYSSHRIHQPSTHYLGSIGGLSHLIIHYVGSIGGLSHFM